MLSSNASANAPLRPVRLTPDHAVRSFALAWLVRPALTPARWRAFVRGQSGGRKRGLIMIEDLRGHAHALYGFVRDYDMVLMPLLRIKIYAVSTFPGLDVYGALVQSFLSMARECNCSRITVDFSECANEGAMSRGIIEQSGFTRSGGNYSKDL